MEKYKSKPIKPTISVVYRKDCSNHINIKTSILMIYISSVFFIFISFYSILIFCANNTSLTFTSFNINILINDLIKRVINIINNNSKKIWRLSSCKHSLVEPIYIKYIDFWPTFKHKKFYFQKLLEKNYQINVIDNNPDNISCYLFYSLFGSNHHNTEYRKCITINYIGENKAPLFSDSDYFIGFSYIKISNRYIRFPLYLIRNSIRKINKTISMNRREKFCAIVISNGNYPLRNRFLDELTRYKKVDSGGKFRNNINQVVNDKIPFLLEYKFSIQMENSATPGYCTEKLFEGFRAGTIPIYHGDESIINIINPKSFIFVKDVADFDHTISLIKALDNNDKKYNKMRDQKVILDDDYLKQEDNKLNNFFSEIFKNNKKYINIFNGKQYF